MYKKIKNIVFVWKICLKWPKKPFFVTWRGPPCRASQRPPGCPSWTGGLLVILNYLFYWNNLFLVKNQFFKSICKIFEISHWTSPSSSSRHRPPAPRIELKFFGKFSNIELVIVTKNHHPTIIFVGLMTKTH